MCMRRKPRLVGGWGGGSVSVCGSGGRWWGVGAVWVCGRGVSCSVVRTMRAEQEGLGCKYLRHEVTASQVGLCRKNLCHEDTATQVGRGGKYLNNEGIATHKL